MYTYKAMQHYYLVAPVIVARKGESLFTYHYDKALPDGSIVRISIGKKQCNGIVVRGVKKPPFDTKAIEAVICDTPLPSPLIQLSNWLSEYYATPLSVALQAILPNGVHKKRRQVSRLTYAPTRHRIKIVLNNQQRQALAAIEASKGTVLLHGVTGSGKTQVYIQAALREFNNGRSSLILVPEIALTPQLVAEFANYFNDVIVTHSKMTESERHQIWLSIIESDSPQIVIGPRSALFMPIKNLGLIVIDECHESSFKQEQNPKYSALRAASVLAKYHKAKTILGSATPSIADYHLASRLDSILRLTKVAKKSTSPVVKIIDCKNRSLFKEQHLLSDELVSSIQRSLNNNKQVLIFHNRRGTSSFALCSHCGWSALCPSCLVPQVLHADKHILKCHLCLRSCPVYLSCPICKYPDVIYKGFGTKQIENTLRSMFPKATIGRFDADNDISEAVHAKYQELYDGKINIIIGTQMIAKGLDLPHLQAVGIVQADNGLSVPDYQSEERVFQLIYQVAGRVGRSDLSSEVIIQSYQPDHPAIRMAIAKDYQSFYDYQIKVRSKAFFPPYTYLLKLQCSYKTERGAINASKRLSDSIKQQFPSTTVLGPTPAFYERLGGAYRWQIVVKSKERAILVKIANSLPQNWQYDLDPASLL